MDINNVAEITLKLKTLKSQEQRTLNMLRVLEQPDNPKYPPIIGVSLTDCSRNPITDKVFLDVDVAIPALDRAYKALHSKVFECEKELAARSQDSTEYYIYNSQRDCFLASATFGPEGRVELSTTIHQEGAVRFPSRDAAETFIRTILDSAKDGKDCYGNPISNWVCKAYITVNPTYQTPYHNPNDK